MIGLSGVPFFSVWPYIMTRVDELSLYISRQASIPISSHINLRMGSARLSFGFSAEPKNRKFRLTDLASESIDLQANYFMKRAWLVERFWRLFTLVGTLLAHWLMLTMTWFDCCKLFGFCNIWSSLSSRDRYEIADCSVPDCIKPPGYLRLDLYVLHSCILHIHW